MFFFVVAPFCSCPASLVSRIFFAVGPGCAKCFSFVALRRAPRPFGGARAKKNTTQGVFFCSGPRERQAKEKPRWAPARGQSKIIKKTQGVSFFAAAPRERSLTHCGPGWRCLGPAGPQQKKNTTGGAFFLRRPRADAHSLTACLGGNASTRRGHSKKKKHPGWCFFCCGPARTLNHSLRAWVAMPRPGGATAKKKKNRVVFFFAAAPRGHSLTHCGPGWQCLGPAGPQQIKKTPRVVFLFDAHSLTAGLGGDASARRGHITLRV